MISLNTVTSALGLSASPGRRVAGAKSIEPNSVPVGDGVMLSCPSVPTEPEVAGSATAARPVRLKEVGWESTMRSLPPEAKAARLLDSKPGPMTQQQRDGCIADLETLHLTGDLKFFDVNTGEYSPCGVAQALERMSQGEPVLYSGGGRQAQMTQFSSLEKLSALAQQAALGIVG